MSSYSNFKVDLNNKNSSWTLIYKKIKNNTTILDIGCSSGYFDDVLIRNKNCIVDGIEIDEKDAKSAAKICRYVTVGNIESATFPWNNLKQTYDYILFVDVLEHLIDPAKVLRNVSKLLKKNGSIIFSIPNMANGAVRLQLLQGNFDYEKEGLLDETHLHYYTDTTIEKMVKDSKLTLTKLDCTTFDVPRDTINDVLKKVGLKTTNEFEKYIRSGLALTYQFIGELKIDGKSAPINRGISSIKPKIDYEKQLIEVQTDALMTFENLTKSNQQIIDQAQLISDLHHELERLRSKGMIKNIYKIAKKVLKNKN